MRPGQTQRRELTLAVSALLVGQPESDVPTGDLWRLPLVTQADGRYHQFYENMRVAAPGDVVFSYCDTLIRAIGVVQGFCYEAPKPIEFGSAGRNWDEIGWRVDVRFAPLAKQVRPLGRVFKPDETLS